MTGFFATLTPEQRGRMLARRGQAEEMMAKHPLAEAKAEEPK